MAYGQNKINMTDEHLTFVVFCNSLYFSEIYSKLEIVVGIFIIPVLSFSFVNDLTFALHSTRVCLLPINRKWWLYQSTNTNNNSTSNKLPNVWQYDVTSCLFFFRTEFQFKRRFGPGAFINFNYPIRSFLYIFFNVFKFPMICYIVAFILKKQRIRHWFIRIFYVPYTVNNFSSGFSPSTTAYIMALSFLNFQVAGEYII